MVTTFRSARRVAAAAFAASMLGFGGAPAVAARPDDALTAGAPGKIVDVAGGRGEGELLRVDARLAPALLALAPEESAAVADWPAAPGARRDVRLSRHDVYAEDARVVHVSGGNVRLDVPRSRLAFFWGTDAAGSTRVLVVVDPDTGALTARTHAPEGEFALDPDAGDRSGRHLLAAVERRPLDILRCGQEDSVETSVDWSPVPPAGRAPAGRSAAVLGSLYKGILAVDTDKEYLASFSNDTTATTNYIATLVANINVMYERDLNLRLVVGTTILRTLTDPWTQTGSGANGPQLTEFTNYWNANYPKSGTPRSFGAIFSGKSTSGLSGIAWLAGSVCGGGNDYSFNQISGHGTWLFGDTLIVGHEIGHNMGSPHTHCYANPAPDRCWASESCYSGAASCPALQTINGVASVTGTIMSYCHLLGGCSTSLVFHPSTITRYVGPALDAGAAGACIAVVVPPPPPPPSPSAASGLHPVTPCRVLDTRNAPGPFGGPALSALSSRTFAVAGSCGVPAGALAVSANVTTVSPAAAGDVLVYPNGVVSPPAASTINLRPGRTRANNAVLYLGTDGNVIVRNGSAGMFDLILDVNGYFK